MSAAAGRDRQAGGAQRYWTESSWPPRPTSTTMPPSPDQPAAPTGQAAPKSPFLALIASFFVPGLGQVVNGQTGKGILMMVGVAICGVLVIVVVGIVALFGLWLWSMVDAYQYAQGWNHRHGILS